MDTGPEAPPTLPGPKSLKQKWRKQAGTDSCHHMPRVKEVLTADKQIRGGRGTDSPEIAQPVIRMGEGDEAAREGVAPPLARRLDEIQEE